ncbi:MAG: hypothetical protein U0V48_06975 [Anaerolineales bacterium]
MTQAHAAVVVDDPRVNGWQEFTFAISPESGCLRSMISPAFPIVAAQIV